MSDSTYKNETEKYGRIKYETIKQLVFPEVLKPILLTFNDKILASFKKDGLPFDRDIDLGELNKDEKFVYTIFLWYSEIDEIISNLNLILDDLALLGKNHKYFIGSPRIRFYLLIRAFFYEFYRVREVFAQVLHVFRQQKKLDKDTVSTIRSTFHEAFSEMIELRNNLVHGSPAWRGKDHSDLGMLSMAQEMGQAIVSRTTGEPWDIQEVLARICQKNVSVLAGEGVRMRDVMQKIIDDAVVILKDRPTSA